ncbi:MAG: MBOAT family protein [Ruminiclostridium sp.]|nr:MBOAT family protein [Ruminiclostridium sp.]
MVFSSLSFLFLFLPLTVVLYYLCPWRRWRNGVLLVASLIFYSWGEPKLLALMVAVSLAAYVGGLLIHRGRGNVRRAWLILTICLLVGNLFAFKYLGLFSRTFRLGLPEIALPIGISFYTFQILSYVIDLYRGKIRVQRNFFSLLLYVSSFPQLIAGPIVRYQTVEEEILCRKENLDDVAAGLRRFILGLSKKVLIANQVALVAETIFASSEAGSGALWLAALSYTLQIYFDFSGYSDMAIGLGRMFGFHFPENFNYPYVSHSVTEFWRRWHISLSTWFRDYIYIPLGGSRKGTGRTMLNLMVVWGLTGFWHGASWNFLLWGLYYGLLLIVEKTFLAGVLEKVPRFVSWVYAMFIVTVGWVIFDLTDLSLLGKILGIMFSFCPTDWTALLAQNASLIWLVLFVPVGVLFSFPVARRFMAWESAAGVAVRNIVCCVLFGLSLAMLVYSSYNPFIYFRF